MQYHLQQVATSVNVRRHQSALASSNYRAGLAFTPSNTGTQKKRTFFRPLKRGLSKDDMHLRGLNEENSKNDRDQTIKEREIQQKSTPLSPIENVPEERCCSIANTTTTCGSRDSRTTSISASGSHFDSNDSNPIVFSTASGGEGENLISPDLRICPGETRSVSCELRYRQSRGRSRSVRYFHKLKIKFGFQVFVKIY